MSRNRKPVEIKNDAVRVRLTPLEKRLLRDRCKKEGYRNMSDFCRAKMVRKREIKKIEVSPEFSTIMKSIDYNLNKIGVNLNQVSKQMNSESIYNITPDDRTMMVQLRQMLQNCFSSLQKYMDILH